MNIKELKQTLLHINNLLPELDQLTASLLGLHSQPYSLTGKTAPLGTPSPIEKTLLQAEQHQGILTTLTNIATEWGWDETQKLAPTPWMASHVEEAAQHYGTIPETHVQTILKLSRLLTYLIIKPTPPQPTKTETLTRLKTYTQHQPEPIWINRALFAKTFQIPTTQIHQWVKNGHITENKNREINLCEAIRLI